MKIDYEVMTLRKQEFYKKLEQAEYTVAGLQAAANKEDAEAQYYLARCYEHGHSVDKDHARAFLLMQAAASQAYAHARRDLGLYYAQGIGIRRNKNKYFDLFLLAANQGDAFAQFLLGAAYHAENQNGTQDYKKAHKFLKYSANQGFAPAQNNLGSYYSQGIGCIKDEKKAIEAFQLAANQDLGSALFNLGVCYLKGLGVKIDAVKAIAFLHDSAKQNFVKAQYHLGVLYKDGCDSALQKDEKKAFEFFLLAARHFHNDNKFNLDLQGKILANIRFLCEKNSHFEKEVKEACDLFALSYCYKVNISSKQDGKNFPPNLRKYLQLLKSSADRGFAIAQSEIGVCHHTGNGVPQNQKEAFKYFVLASKHDIAEAQYNLGICYLQGIAVKQDIGIALSLLQLAAEQDHVQAQYNLGHHYSLEGPSKDLHKSFEYFELAAAQGFAHAQLRLAKCYANGLGVTKNIQKAAFYTTLANQSMGSQSTAPAADQKRAAELLQQRNLANANGHAAAGAGAGAANAAGAGAGSSNPPSRPTGMGARR